MNRYSFGFVIVFLGLLLAQAFPLAETLPSQFDDFPAHDSMITSVTEFRLRMGDRVFHDTLVGPNGWLVYATDRGMDKFQKIIRPLTDAELADYAISLLNFQTLVEKNGGHLLFVAAPYKNTVYPEFVPAEVRPIGETSHIDRILHSLRLYPSIQTLDLRPTMFAAKQDAQIYYSTYTHWNDLGGLAAYQAIIEALQPTFPQLVPHTISDFKVTLQPPKLMDLALVIGSDSLSEERVQLQPLFKETSHADSLVLPS